MAMLEWGFALGRRYLGRDWQTAQENPLKIERKWGMPFGVFSLLALSISKAMISIKTGMVHEPNLP